MRILASGMDVAPERGVLEALFLATLGESQFEKAVLGPDALLPDIVIEPAAVLACVAGKCDKQNHRSVGEVVVKPVIGSSAVNDHRRLARAELVGEGLNLMRRKTSQFRDFLGRICSKSGTELGEDRNDLGHIS